VFLLMLLKPREADDVLAANLAMENLVRAGDMVVQFAAVAKRLGAFFYCGCKLPLVRDRR
jgi:hypothetical protein